MDAEVFGKVHDLIQFPGVGRRNPARSRPFRIKPRMRDIQLLKTGRASDSVTSETLGLLYVLVYGSMTYVERLVQDRDVLAKVCSIAKDVTKPGDQAGYCFGIITAVLWKLNSKESFL